MGMFRALCASAFSLSLLFIGNSVQADWDPIFGREGPLVFAHRGGARENPESTRKAFREALILAKVDVLEIDIHATTDNKFVVWHGPSLGKLKIKGLAHENSKRPAAKRKIGDVSWADDLREKAWVRFDEKSVGDVPEEKDRALMLLEEALIEFPTANFNIEMKNTIKKAHLPKLIKLLDQHKKTRQIVVASATHTILKQFRKACSGRYITNMSAIEVVALRIGLVGPRKPKAGEGKVLEAPYSETIVSRKVIKRVRSFGGRTYVFITAFIASTALDKTEQSLKYKDIAKLLDRGIDGIITDRPRALRPLVDRWKAEQLKKEKTKELMK
jgi:glycerophosphoryl diester phosphodiesterase